MHPYEVALHGLRGSVAEREEESQISDDREGERRKEYRSGGQVEIVAHIVHIPDVFKGRRSPSMGMSWRLPDTSAGRSSSARR